MSEIASAELSAGKGAVTTDSLQSVEEALARAFELLEQDPRAALEEANRSLGIVPGHPVARLVTAIAQRRLNDSPAALSTLGELVRE